jgi:Cys-rich four helix bundle protein (predicted Tat secretion target)
MNRRHLLNTVAMASLATLAQTASARHEHHAHGSGHSGDARGPNADLVSAASQCVATGQVCLAHCIRLLSEGDDSMSDCAKSINQMLGLCGALQNLAAQGAPLVPALAKVAIQGCTECADACKPHVNHHAECKACYEACQACIRQCEAVS